MAYRVRASFGKERITTQKPLSKVKAQKLANYINRKKPGANAKVVQR
jgi:hypothetical protein